MLSRFPPYIIKNCPRCTVSSVDITGADCRVTATTSTLPECICGNSTMSITEIVSEPEIEAKQPEKFKGVDLLIGDKKEKKKIAREWRKLSRRK